MSEIKMRELVITPTEVESRKAYLDQQLRDLKFYKKINDTTEKTSEEAQLIRDSFLNFYAIQKTLVNILNDKYSGFLKSKGLPSDSFHQMYSSYIAATVSLSQLSSIDLHVSLNKELANIFSGKELDFSNEFKFLQDEEIETLESRLTNRKVPPVNMLENFYLWLIEQSISQASDEKYREINNQYKNLKIILNIDKSKNHSKIRIFKGIKEHGLYFETSQQGATDFKLTWDHFAGYPDVKEYFQDQVFLIENYEKALSKASVTTIFPRGILLTGPRGTGKTTIAQLFCQYANIPFRKISVKDVGSIYCFGASGKLKDEFEKIINPIRLGQSVASLLFIDELDAIAPQRTNGSDGSKEYSNLVSVFNIYMDGDQYVPGVMVVGATNREEDIDVAIRSRFRTIFQMNYPTKDGLKDIFYAVVNRLERENNCNKLVAIKNMDEIIEESFNKKFVGRDFKNILENLIRKGTVDFVKKNIDPYPIPESRILDSIRNYVRPLY